MTDSRIGSLLRFKPGVDRSAVHPMMFAWLGAVSIYHVEITEEPLTVTSLRRSYNPQVKTKHAPPPPRLVSAADIRRRELDALDDPNELRSAAAFCRELQRCYGRHLGVVLEPEWLTVRQLEKRFGIRIRNKSQERAARKRVGPHIHLQLKGRLWSP